LSARGRNVLFLDVDGVLSPFGDRAFAPRCMAELVRVVRASEALIVLSSTWRTSSYTLRAVNERLAAVDLAHCFDVTPQLAGLGAGDTRVMEILQWLGSAAGQGVRQWVAVDDMNLAWKHEQTMRGHFVRTLSHEGLTAANADEAMALLAFTASPQ